MFIIIIIHISSNNIITLFHYKSVIFLHSTLFQHWFLKESDEVVNIFGVSEHGSAGPPGPQGPAGETSFDVVTWFPNFSKKLINENERVCLMIEDQSSDVSLSENKHVIKWC